MSDDVYVWADGFGTWHAEVPVTDNALADANHARRLIITALAEREGFQFDPRTVHVTRKRASATRATYCEK